MLHFLMDQHGLKQKDLAGVFGTPSIVSEVLAYSRSRGLFAGISVSGAVIGQDQDATRELYGRLVPFKTILSGAVATPQAGEPFISSVRKATATGAAPAGPKKLWLVPHAGHEKALRAAPAKFHRRVLAFFIAGQVDD